MLPNFPKRTNKTLQQCVNLSKLSKNCVKTLQPQGESKRKLSEEQNQTIIQWVDNNCDLTIEKIH